MKDLIMEYDNLITGPYLNSQDKNPEMLIIFLHGWGSNGNDLIQLAPFFAQSFPKAHFLSPHGPEECPQNPFEGKQWFGLDFNIDGTINRDNMPQKVKNASEHVKNFINYWQKEYNIDKNQTYLIGFSQGSMVALEIGSKIILGGLLCYSGSFINNNYPLSKDNKIMLIHGELDDTIPINNMQNAKNSLLTLGADVESYICKDLAHSINEEGIKIGIEFLKKCNI